MKIVPLLLVASLSACINRTGLFEKSLFAYGTVCYFSFKSTSNPKGEQSIKDFSNLLLTYDAMADATINRELAGVYGLNQTNLGRGSWFYLDNETIAEFAKELGYDGVVFKRIKEGSYGNVNMDTTYIVYSTKQLKSPFENNGDFGDVENIFK
jgi:hypothetical protein